MTQTTPFSGEIFHLWGECCHAGPIFAEFEERTHPASHHTSATGSWQVDPLCVRMCLHAPNGTVSFPAFTYSAVDNRLLAAELTAGYRPISRNDRRLASETVDFLDNGVGFEVLCHAVVSWKRTKFVTRSFADVERPRVVSYRSAISFNSTITWAHFSVTRLSLRLQIYQSTAYTIKFCSVVFGVTLRLLVINTSSSVCRHQQTPPLTATSDECH